MGSRPLYRRTKPGIGGPGVKGEAVELSSAGSMPKIRLHEDILNETSNHRRGPLEDASVTELPNPPEGEID